MAKRTAEARLKHVALANKMTEVSAIGNNQGITLLGNFRLTRSFRWMQQEFSNDEHRGSAFFELSRLLLIGGDGHPLALVGRLLITALLTSNTTLVPIGPPAPSTISC
jgi:hypothetical protein